MIALPKPEPEEEPTGGLGGSALRPNGIRDTRLLERAIRWGWPIPQKYRKPIVERQVRIALDPLSSPREATSAFRSLVAAEQQNVDRVLRSVGSDKDAGSTTNQQINIYLPANGREAIEQTNGHNGNGKH